MRVLFFVSTFLLLVLSARGDDGSNQVQSIETITEGSPTTSTQGPILDEVIEDSDVESTRLIPRHFDPDPASPDPASPDPASPDPASPDPASPDLVSPDLASPDLASPDLVTKNERRSTPLSNGQDLDENIPSHLKGFHDLLFMEEANKEHERRPTLDLGSNTPNPNLERKNAQLNGGKFDQIHFEVVSLQNEKRDVPDEEGDLIQNDFPGGMRIMNTPQQMNGNFPPNPQLENSIQQKDRGGLVMNGFPPHQVRSVPHEGRDPLSDPQPVNMVQHIPMMSHQMQPIARQLGGHGIPMNGPDLGTMLRGGNVGANSVPKIGSGSRITGPMGQMRRNAEMSHTSIILPNGMGSQKASNVESNQPNNLGPIFGPRDLGMRSHLNPVLSFDPNNQNTRTMNLDDEQQLQNRNVNPEGPIFRDMDRRHPMLIKNAHKPVGSIPDDETVEGDNSKNRRQFPNPMQGGSGQGMRLSPMEQAIMAEHARRRFIMNQMEQQIEKHMNRQLNQNRQSNQNQKSNQNQRSNQNQGSGKDEGIESPNSENGRLLPRQRSTTSESPSHTMIPMQPLNKQQVIFRLMNNRIQPMVRVVNTMGMPTMILPMSSPAIIEQHSFMTSPWTKSTEKRNLPSRAITVINHEEEEDEDIRGDLKGQMKKPITDDLPRMVLEMGSTDSEVTCHSKDCGLLSDQRQQGPGRGKKVNKVLIPVPITTTTTTAETPTTETTTTETTTTTITTPASVTEDPNEALIIDLREENANLLESLKQQRFQQEAVLRTQIEQDRREKEQNEIAMSLISMKDELMEAHRKLEQQQLAMAKQLEEQIALFNQQSEQQQQTVLAQQQQIQVQQQQQHFVNQMTNNPLAQQQFPSQQQILDPQLFSNQQQQFPNQQTFPQQQPFMDPMSNNNPIMLNGNSMIGNNPEMMSERQEPSPQHQPLVQPETGEEQEEPPMGVMSLERQNVARSLPRPATHPDIVTQDQQQNWIQEIGNNQGGIVGVQSSEQIDAICGLKDVGQVPSCVANYPSWKEILRQPINCPNDLMTRVGGARKKREWRCFCGFFDE